MKPDNILFFKKKGEWGLLQISDLGLSTSHEHNTEVRTAWGMETITPSGLRRYEPPEEDERRSAKTPRGRSYDIWSMGCTLLELLIWLAYGFKVLQKFQDQTGYFWAVNHAAGGSPKYTLHREADRFIGALTKNPKVCEACKDMVELVRSRMLFIVEKKNGKSLNGQRATAQEVHNNMQDIFRRCEDASYLTAEGLDRSSVPPGIVYEDGGSLVPPTTKEVIRESKLLPKVVTPEESDKNLRPERQASATGGSLQVPHESQVTIHDSVSSL